VSEMLALMVDLVSHSESWCLDKTLGGPGWKVLDSGLIDLAPEATDVPLKYRNDCLNILTPNVVRWPLIFVRSASNV